MRSALTTAAGVAGGMLVADSIRNMLGGGAHASPHHDAGAGGGARQQDARYVDDKDNDPGNASPPPTRTTATIRASIPAAAATDRDLSAAAGVRPFAESSRRMQRRPRGLTPSAFLYAPALPAIFSAKA